MEIVTALRRGLVQRLGQQRYDLWFGSTVTLRWAPGALTVVAPDQFLLDRLKLRFRADLEDLCLQVVGTPPSIQFTVDATGRTLATPEVFLERNEKDERRLPVVAAEASETGDGAVSKPALPRRPLGNFDSFVVGDSNRVACTAAQMISRRLGTVSPLFLHGPTGTGKTHLLEAILHHTRRLGLVKRSLLLSAEQFTAHFLEALQGSGLPSFRRKYRDVELLVIDDVHFFAGKRATLVELQHTLDTLLRAGRQVVLAADRAPAALTGLGTELVTRMSGGVVCGIEAPEYETRLELVQRMADSRQLAIPTEVAQLIASRIDRDARHLAGALNRLEAVSAAHAQAITREFAEQSLGDIFQSACRVLRLADIERAVCEVFGLEAKSLQESTKAKDISQPRMLAMWLARKYTRAAFSEIGRHFGRRSHSSVIAAQKKVEQWVGDRAPVRLGNGECSAEEALRRVESRLRAG